jgi:hypothetical protein
MLFLDTVKPDTLDTLRRLQALPVLAETRLVGGTALALQVGHRVSVDLDMFGIWDKRVDLGEVFGQCGTVVTEHVTENIQVFQVSGIKVDVVYYRYPWLDEAVNECGLRLASLRDITSMKLEAINSRGSKRDFIDLATLLERFTLSEMLKGYLSKYSRGSEYLVLRSLCYFDDAEEDPMPAMLKPMRWESVKERIRQAVRTCGLS